MRYEVPPEAGGLTLGKFLFDRLRLSRNLVRKAKNSEGLLVDGRPVRTSHVLAVGQVVELQVEAHGRVEPEPMALAIVYEDAQVLVVDKPAGIVVHPVRDYQHGTLAQGVAYHLQQRGEQPVARPVQRIDRETSGLVLFAKNPAVAGQLAAELEKHKLERRYMALVRGRVEGEQGMVRVPIRRVWGHPVAREAAVGPRTPEQEALLAAAEAGGQVLRDEWKAAGQPAVTHWQIVRRWPEATMLALQLETGRTHQIRVHMAHVGHPLLGDSLYGQAGPPGRQALHAATLAFTHPVTGVAVRLESPLPADLVAFAAELDAAAGRNPHHPESP
ncbi:MAG TPA: RluA family pseudouridine synthase [Symbiobacteriaceae bacterium]|nr:RluA family pseudouridine synthase [Symbiobacteriaceae bacterium]